jgi:hypothetical protein
MRARARKFASIRPKWVFASSRPATLKVTTQNVLSVRSARERSRCNTRANSASELTGFALAAAVARKRRAKNLAIRPFQECLDE